MGSSAQSPEMTSRGDEGSEREVQEEGDVCTHKAVYINKADSLC